MEKLITSKIPDVIDYNDVHDRDCADTLRLSTSILSLSICIDTLISDKRTAFEIALRMIPTA